MLFDSSVDTDHGPVSVLRMAGSVGHMLIVNLSYDTVNNGFFSKLE